MRLFFNSHQINVLNRTLVSVLGGAVFSVLLSLVISFLLPIEKMHAVAWSTMLVFITFPAVVMWIFGTQNFKNASLYLFVSVVFLLAACWLLMPVGGSI